MLDAEGWLEVDGEAYGPLPKRLTRESAEGEDNGPRYPIVGKEHLAERAVQLAAALREGGPHVAQAQPLQVRDERLSGDEGHQPRPRR